MKITAKVNGNKTTTIAKDEVIASDNGYTIIHPVLTPDVMGCMEYFTQYHNQRLGTIDELMKNAFIYDQTAGLSVYAGADKIKGATAWTISGKERINDFGDCIRGTIEFGRLLDNLVLDIKALKDRFAGVLYYWQSFMIGCKDYEALINDFFLCSIVYVTLRENPKSVAGDIAEYSDMWQWVINLLSELTDELKNIEQAAGN